MNIVIASGRLVKEGVFKEANGTFVYNNSIAIKREYQENGEYQTDFMDISAFGGCAKYLNEYAKKGDLILIQGTLYTNTYNDKNGVERKSVSIKVSKVNQMTFKKKDEEKGFEEEEQGQLPF